MAEYFSDCDHPDQGSRRRSLFGNPGLKLLILNLNPSTALIVGLAEAARQFIHISRRRAETPPTRSIELAGVAGAMERAARVGVVNHATQVRADGL